MQWLEIGGDSKGGRENPDEMLTSYSPQREGSSSAGGGMLHFQSPTHPHHHQHYDPHSAIREIRRSLSRSPSKPYNFRSSHLQAVNTPYAPSPLSPSRKSHSENLFQYHHFSTTTTSTTAAASPHMTRSAQPGRFQRPALRRTGQTIGSIRTRTSPKSPSKRVLTEQTDLDQHHHNNTVTMRKRRSTEIDEEEDGQGHQEDGQDNMDFLQGENKENASSHNEDQIMSWKTAQTKQERRRSGGLLMEIQPRSPMTKRSDGAMNMDQPDFGSPSAKRRSLHAPPSMDFSIFEADHGHSFLSRDGDRRAQDDNWFRSIPSSPASKFSTIPKRSSSLRKSTLQQRQSDRSSPMRPNNNNNNFSDLRQTWAETASTSKKPPKMSLDLPSVVPRDGPFATTQGTPVASVSFDPITVPPPPPPLQETSMFRHPLAHTLTHSSYSTSSTPSTSGVDSPIQEHVVLQQQRQTDRSRSHDFSKSLPVGATRPPLGDLGDGSSQASSQFSFATPAAYKAIKPLPAAFLSTGLISKKNRNVDDQLPKALMPDTPCKKQTIMFPPPKDKIKPANATIRNLQQNVCATPQSPSELPFGVTRMNPFPWAKSTGLFANKARQSMARKASFASLISIESDDKPQSQQSSSSIPVIPPTDSQSSTTTTESEYPPTPTKPDVGSHPGRFSSVSPSPQHTLPKARPPPSSSQVSKFVFMSPHVDDFDGSSPHTPLHSIFPPDPSTLSISGKQERPATRHGHDQQSNYIPATPTGPREYFGNFFNRSTLNLHAPQVSDVDSSLTSRFDTVDLVGTGEFSQVYRVSEPPQPSAFTKPVNGARPSSRGSLLGRVWAVKKSRQPYSGPKDRARKVHEVDALKALGQNDHIITFVDSWEERCHLYIQTEFCDEGTLDVFLAQVGVQARLDDFRIWKILLEISLGLEHIHDSGFIHLDLKPANIFITFEGVLKIGDFGMATKWPARPGIEGEGDREYIGPEILMGRYDKPADIFALGLIMLETAGNVQLPDNGASWQKLRSGDMSDVPSLTWSDEDSCVVRDASGNPMVAAATADDDHHDADEFEDVDLEVVQPVSDVIPTSRASRAAHMTRRGELIHPPSFMADAADENALDGLVRWMISPNPDDRPEIERILRSSGVEWVESRRRAGATIFEGNWGPADEVLAEDAEMIDV